MVFCTISLIDHVSWEIGASSTLRCNKKCIKPKLSGESLCVLSRNQLELVVKSYRSLLEAAPDDQGLIDVSPRCEGNDVVTATQLGKGMCLGVLLQLDTPFSTPHINHPCRSTASVKVLKLLLSRQISFAGFHDLA